MLKRLTVIFFFVLYVVVNTEAKQFLKFPVLLEHYAEHQQNNRNISFLDFMYMHYAGNDFNDKDQDRDRQLPFKSYQTYTALDAPCLAAQEDAVYLPLIALNSKITLFYKELNIASSYLSSIWQPPRLA